jgi:gamma-glutamyltranspeptidase / glutathione hydrolase
MKRRHFIGNSLLGAAAISTSGYAANNSETTIPPDNWVKRRKKLVSEAYFGRKKGVSSSKGVAISSNPLVSQEAIDVLKAGGNAADAILAASIVQSVVEPHMTTLTGVFSMLYYDAKTGKTKYVNGSCNAPLAHKKAEFKMADLPKIVKTANGALVPGFWGGFEKSHQVFGTMPLKKLMANAVRYAKEGFEAYPFLYGEIFDSADWISASEDGREIYFPKGNLIQPNELVIQRKLGDVLTRLQEEGSRYFYHGDFAKNYCKVVQDAGGIVTVADFERYEAMVQDPVKGSYRGYEILASPSPDMGGEVIIEMMQLAELYDWKKNGPIHQSYDSTLKAMQIAGEVLNKGMFESLMGKQPPLEKRLSKKYAEERFAKLNGKPAALEDLYKAEAPKIIPGSNHLTVIDAQGNVATVLHSVMALPWNNTLYVDGVSIASPIYHYAMGVPNGGERINARIGPHMFMKNGKPILAGGSPSVSLMENVLQTSINILDFGLPVEEAVHLPRFGGSSIKDPSKKLIERGYNPDVIKNIEKLGVSFDLVRQWQWHMGSYEGVYIDPVTNLRSACGDPRRASQAKAE